jgi:hypothetical protein
MLGCWRTSGRLVDNVSGRPPKSLTTPTKYGKFGLATFNMDLATVMAHSAFSQNAIPPGTGGCGQMRVPGSSNASEAGVLNPLITDVQSLHRVVS